jgi:hypothetical protein
MFIISHEVFNYSFVQVNSWHTPSVSRCAVESQNKMLLVYRQINIWYSLITCTNLMHFTITFTVLKLKASTCFGHHLSIASTCFGHHVPILRRHYSNTVLMGVTCCK